MEKTCDRCGKKFRASNNSKYCSEECRRDAKLEQKRLWMKSYRKRESEIRKKREHDTRLQVGKRLEIERIEKAKQSRTAFMKRVAIGDETARLLYLRATKPFSAEYWDAFRQYDDKYGGSMVSVINGIRTDDPNFIDAVVITIGEERIIRQWVERRNKSMIERNSNG